MSAVDEATTPELASAEVLTPDAFHAAHAAAMAMCDAVGIDHVYCERIDFEVHRVTFHLYKGRDGRCQGPKHVIGAGTLRNSPPDPIPEGWGEPAREVVVFELPPGPINETTSNAPSA